VAGADSARGLIRARGSLWLIGIGVLGAAAALVGSLDLLGLAAGSRAHRIALVQMAVNITVTAGNVAAFLWRRDARSPGGSSHSRDQCGDLRDLPGRARRASSPTRTP
jgi:hypothetical protein